jgi:hypothetical protein
MFEAAQASTRLPRLTSCSTASTTAVVLPAQRGVLLYQRLCAMLTLLQFAVLHSVWHSGCRCDDACTPVPGGPCMSAMSCAASARLTAALWLSSRPGQGVSAGWSRPDTQGVTDAAMWSCPWKGGSWTSV